MLVELIFWFNFAALYPDLVHRGAVHRLPVPGLDTNAMISPLTAAIIGSTLNEAADMAEVIRGGFAAVDKGQIEAADSLGMSYSKKLRAVLLPQIMPAVPPPTGNQLISMLKGHHLGQVRSASRGRSRVPSSSTVYLRDRPAAHRRQPLVPDHDRRR